jgi:hypothetical protein
MKAIFLLFLLPFTTLFAQSRVESIKDFFANPNTKVSNLEHSKYMQCLIANEYNFTALRQAYTTNNRKKARTP